MGTPLTPQLVFPFSHPPSILFILFLTSHTGQLTFFFWGDVEKYENFLVEFVHIFEDSVLHLCCRIPMSILC